MTPSFVLIATMKDVIALYLRKPAAQLKSSISWLKNNWKQSLIITFITFIVVNLPTYVSLWRTLNPAPMLKGEIFNQMFFSEMKIVKSAFALQSGNSTKHNFLGVAPVFIVNTSTNPKLIRRVEISLETNGQAIEIRSAIPNPSEEWLDFVLGKDNVKLNWKRSHLLHSLHEKPLNPGIPISGNVSFVFESTPQVISALKKDNLNLTITVETYDGDKSPISRGNKTSTLFLSSVLVNDIFYTNDGPISSVLSRQGD